MTLKVHHRTGVCDTCGTTLVLTGSATIRCHPAAHDPARSCEGSGRAPAEGSVIDRYQPQRYNRPRKAPSGLCQVCGREVALTPEGTARRHQRYVDGTAVGRCLGSRLAPLQRGEPR